MGAKKFEDFASPASKRRPQPSTDPALYVFYATVGIGLLWVIALAVKIKAPAMIVPLFFTPALCVLLGRTWKSGFRYAIYSSLVLPVVTLGLLALVLVVGTVLSKSPAPLMKHSKMLIGAPLTIWVVFLSAAAFSISCAAGARAVWEYFKR